MQFNFLTKLIFFQAILLLLALIHHQLKECKREFLSFETVTLLVTFLIEFRKKI